MPVMSRVLLSLILASLLSACSTPPREYRDTMLVFGTLVDVTLYDVDNKTAVSAFNKLRKDFNILHVMWHPWKPGPMGRTNKLLASGQPFTIDPGVLPLIIKSRQLVVNSQHLYNPAIGKLLDLWGFHSDAGPHGPPPPAAAIEKLVRQNPQISDVEVNGSQVQSHNPAVEFDFSAMAKGLAVEREIDYLRKLGIKNAIINAGGDIKAIGRHGDRPWHVGVRHPRRTGVVASLDVADGESVFTSGDYERYFKDKNKRYGHIIDPRTGYPANQSTSVTVITGDAATADAAATALFVAGPKQWVSVAKSMGIKYVLLIDRKNVVYMTPAMAARVHFEQQPEKIEISPEIIE